MLFTVIYNTNLCLVFLIEIKNTSLWLKIMTSALKINRNMYNIQSQIKVNNAWFYYENYKHQFAVKRNDISMKR